MPCDGVGWFGGSQLVERQLFLLTDSLLITSRLEKASPVPKRKSVASNAPPHLAFDLTCRYTVEALVELSVCKLRDVPSKPVQVVPLVDWVM